MTQLTDDFVAPLVITSAALDTVLETRAAEDDPQNTALRVSVTGATLTDYKYVLELITTDEIEEADVVYPQGDHDEISVVVPEKSVEALNGSKLDLASGSSNGLIIKNPNRPDPMFGKDLNLDGPLDERVQTVLDAVVNPALSSHGGFAELVKLDGSVAHVRMGGGCQGCAASAVTLKDGIRKMLIDAVGDLSDVVDVTDHDAGENPYYTSPPV